MKTTTSTMPNDPEILQKMVAQMQAKLDSQETLIATLRHQLAVLKRSRFGSSSEKVDKQIQQLELQLEELEIHAAELPQLDLGEPVVKATPRRRKQLPAQWVLSLPIPLRLLLTRNPSELSKVMQIIHRAISTHNVNKAGFTNKQAKTGAVTLI